MRVHELLNSFTFRIDGVMEASPNHLAIQSLGNQLKLSVEHVRVNLSPFLSLAEEKIDKAAQSILKPLIQELENYEKGKLPLKAVIFPPIHIFPLPSHLPYLIAFSPRVIFPEAASPLTISCHGYFPSAKTKPVLHFGKKQYAANFQSLQKLTFLVDLPTLFPNLGKNHGALASRMRAMIPWEQQGKEEQSLFSVLIKTLPIHAGTICITYKTKTKKPSNREIIVGIHACSEGRCSKGHNWCGGCQRTVTHDVPLAPGETVIGWQPRVDWHHKKGEYITCENRGGKYVAVAFAPDGNARIDGALIVKAQHMVNVIKEHQFTQGKFGWNQSHHLITAKLVSWKVTFQPFDHPEPFIYKPGVPHPLHRYIDVKGDANGVLVKAVPPKELAN